MHVFIYPPKSEQQVRPGTPRAEMPLVYHKFAQLNHGKLTIS